MIGEGLDAVADGVARGLAASNNQQQDEGAELLGREALAVHLGVHELTGDVVAWPGHPALARRLRVLEDLGPGAQHGVEWVTTTAVVRVRRTHKGVRPAKDPTLVL